MTTINPKRETIVVAPSARGQVLLGFSISTRLANVLRLQKVERLGELHGLTFAEISRYRNCGSATVEELRRLVGSLHAGRKPGPAGTHGLPAYKFFPVPKYARQFHPSDLPMSARLANVLERNGVVRLADLRERTPFDFKRLANCGPATCDELARLMIRVAASEFQPVVRSFSITKLAPALRPLDDALAALPEDWRNMLLLHLSGDPSEPGTLTELASRFRLTRSRIGQIVESSVEEIKKSAALKMRGYLDGMAAYCLAQLCPLSPALLSRWLAKSRASDRHRSGFYVRLFGKLNPAIPVWLHGQDSHQDVGAGSGNIMRHGNGASRQRQGFAF